MWMDGMKYCKQFRKFCDGICLECYDYIGSLNQKQYYYELRKKHGDGKRGDNAVSKLREKEMQEMR
jgi:spermidine synthase